MKATYQHLPELEKSKTLSSFKVSSPRFDFHWHYHPQIEITYVEEGFGTRLIGDCVANFERGDFVLIGSNLPHTWISSEDFNELPQQMKVGVLQFDKSIINEQLINQKEFKNIKSLFERSKRGIYFKQEYNAKAINIFNQIIEAKGIEKYTWFLNLLDLLGKEKKHQFICSSAYVPILNESTEYRISTVCKFIHENFMQNLELNQISKLANMNPSAFCRFFKKTTGQSLFEYINELRISKAANLLLNKKDLSISSVAHLSGFNNQSHFNRVFLNYKQTTPSDYKKRIAMK